MKQAISDFLARRGMMMYAWDLLFRLRMDGLTRTLKKGNAQNMGLEGKKKYFEINRNRIDAINCNWADDLSRKIYCNQIMYRCTLDRKYNKPYNISNQYFPEDIIKLKEEEVFVDCGAFVGDTYKVFKKKSKNKYKKYIAFEPDRKSFVYLSKLAKKDNRLVMFEKALGEKREKLYLQEAGSGSKMVNNPSEESYEVEVVPLDEINEVYDATFVKMDMEGAEFNTILGMNNLIENKTPILAICIYHTDEDMIRIPEIIREKYPWYKLYLRQHFCLPTETVLYAIPGDRLK